MKFFGRKSKITDQPKTALCLGGGGARGFAHIGAIKAFEEAGISFDMVVGTSAGSLVGALYACGIKSETMIRYADSIQFKDLHNGIFITPNDPMKIGRVVTDIIGVAEIANFKTKFAAVAVDLIEGRQTVLDSGNASIAVAASCAVPLLYRPVSYGGKHLVDGGLLNNIPADVCRMLGASRVITVDVNPTRGGGTRDLGLFDVLKASFQIMSANSSVAGLRLSDVIIAPDTSAYSSASKTGYKEMIELGYQAAKEKIEKGELRSAPVLESRRDKRKKIR